MNEESDNKGTGIYFWDVGPGVLQHHKETRGLFDFQDFHPRLLLNLLFIN